MFRIKDLITAMRPYQWYKNILVFLAIIFSRNFLIFNDWILLIIGFFSLCLISSAAYLCNDVIDVKRDRKNPEKANRPIASGAISVPTALSSSIIILSIGLLIAYMINPLFATVGVILFMMSLIYSFYIKHILFADIITISFNFVLRAVAGAIIISVDISPWLIIGIFFLGLYFVTGKRYSEIYLLKEISKTHRPVLSEYSKEILLSLFSIFLAVLIVIYALFSFLSENQNLLWTIPLFLYLLLRYYHLILSGNKIARHFEKIITDPPIIIGSILLFIAIIILIIW
ncbi:MAG: UbiA prenyltransferase family protein [Nanoarchaeota archaeon]|nr:UbiA prenyltransferase family protein [Nanoarchaeota archaeon]MBU1631814.1 UbiA prenyltransferase family protein [Nanoarchaeota archaeon]